MQQIADEVARLPHKHVAFQILQQSFSFGRIQYWTRTAPRELVSSLIEYHSQLHKQLMESLLEQPLPAQQWLQARLPIRYGGLGLLSSRYELGMRVFHVADLVYVSARRQSYEHISRLVSGYEALAGIFEHDAVQHLSFFYPTHGASLSKPSAPLDQASMLQNLHEAIFQDLLQSSTVAQQARLRAVAAPGAGAWLQVAPSPTRDLLFSDIAFSDVVSMRLGVPIFQGDEGCTYCGQALDPCGHHIMSCMRQGNKYGIHNSLRKTVHRFAQMAGLRPVLEPTGLITGSTQIRPADTLLIAPPSLKPNSWRKFPRLALDLAVTCPVTQPLIAQAAAETLSAAENMPTASAGLVTSPCDARLQTWAMSRWYSRVLAGSKEEVWSSYLVSALKLTNNNNPGLARLSVFARRVFLSICSEGCTEL